MTESSNSSNSKHQSWQKNLFSQPGFWIIAVVALVLGYILGGTGSDRSQSTGEMTGAATTEVWTCSMHPQFKLPEAGQCPICFMDLIPITDDSQNEDGPRVLAMSATARQLARIVTAPVERRYVDAVVRLVGKIDYDETRLAHIPALVPGELDRLFVDYTGIEVQKGDHMVVIDSPGLLAAQEELLQALTAARETEGSNLGSIRRTGSSTIHAAREKLRRWGLADDQITEIEKRGTASDQVTLYAPIGGVVVEKNALEGTYVHIGTPIYTIADLTRVWVMLEAYESDLAWLRYGQEITFTTAAIPGEQFAGTITFIDPILNANTRTVKVRVNVDNKDRKLKPGMFVRATVSATVAAGGKVMDASLAGHWICPMHPGVVKTRRGDCDICGMPIVTAESLGYAQVSQESHPPPLVIPATAPLITGRRAVVYVEMPGRDRPTYEGREVILGPRAGDFYLVESGLDEGERVVTNGAFKIDSELQIRAGASMMSPAGGTEMSMSKTLPPAKPRQIADVPDRFHTMLGPVYDAYFELQRALADDDHPGALDALNQLYLKIHTADAGSLPLAARGEWDQLRERIRATASASDSDNEWKALRARFETIAAVMIEIDYLFGHTDDHEHVVTFCPMAFNNRGAYWLQDYDSILNPYFGKAMLKCGKVTDRIAAGLQDRDD